MYTGGSRLGSKTHIVGTGYRLVIRSSDVGGFAAISDCLVA